MCLRWIFVAPQKADHIGEDVIVSFNLVRVMCFLWMGKKKRLQQETCWLVEKKRWLPVGWEESGCEHFDSSCQQEGWPTFSKTVAMWEWDDLFWMEADLKYSLLAFLFVSCFCFFLLSRSLKFSYHSAPAACSSTLPQTLHINRTLM